MFLYAVTKVATNDEMVKQMQEQVISMQEKQISFLNDTISNTYTALGVIVALVAIFAAGVVTWINRTHLKAQKTMKQAEQTLGDATAARENLLADMEKLDNYREETRREFEELNKLVNSDEIKKIKDDTKILYEKHKISATLGQVESMINKGQNMIEALRSTGYKIQGVEFNYFKECKYKFRYLKNHSRHALEEVGIAEEIASDCRELEQESFDATNRLEKIWKQHYTENLAEGTES